LGESFQENLLRRFFDQAALAKESAGDFEYARTVAPDDLGKGGLVFGACLTREREVRCLLVAVRQKRSSSETTDGGFVVRESAAPQGKRLLVIAPSTSLLHFAEPSFELRFQLFQLRLLLSGQHGLHCLMELEFLAHQFSLQARHFR
jgi:hypothetical protein